MVKVKLDPYLFFSGNCRKAMEFYKSIFGGKLSIQTVEEFPGDFPGKEKMKGMIMHAMLDGDVRLMASDSPKASPKAAKVELSLSGEDQAKLRSYWEALSKKGSITMPLEKAEWGDIFGMVKDKFGIDWMVNISVRKG